MNNSYSGNKDDSIDNRMVVIKPRVMIRRSKPRICCKTQPFLTLQTLHKHPEPQSPLIHSSPTHYFKDRKDSSNSPASKKSRFFAFEVNNLSITSLVESNDIKSNEISPMLKNSFYMVSNDFRTKTQNFRRMKFTPLRIRLESSLAYDDKSQMNQSYVKADKKHRNIKRELIPQTKACVGGKAKGHVANLRISGVIKDFSSREMQLKVKDSADGTDFEVN